MTAGDTVKDLHVEVKRCPECGTGFGVEAAFCPFDGIALKASTWDPTRDPLTDTVIDQRYEVIAPLGEGGMGTVYKVRHVTLDRMFALKVLRRDLAADPGLAARFLQEARATAAIRHPAVVAISDFGTLEDGAPYFVMDLLVGETLATRMRARGLLSPREAASIARKLADALSTAHAANVVHRDLKPENVFLVRGAGGKAGTQDEVRIVDFGAAKIVGGSKLTRPGVVFGTPYYMSPEQAGGQPVDARADIYSLGVLLYEMITGAVPFEADTYMGVLTKHMFASPAKPSERAPSGVQLGDLEVVVMRALEKDPPDRYQSMAEFGAAIDRAIEGRPSEAPKARTPSARPVAFTSMSTADKIERSVARQLLEVHRRSRRMRLVIAAVAMATVAIGATALVLIEGGGTPWSKRSEPSGSSASGSSASGPSASGPSASGPSASGPSASGPSASGSSALVDEPPASAAAPSSTMAVAPPPVTSAPAVASARAVPSARSSAASTGGPVTARPRPPPEAASPRATSRPPSDPFTGKPPPPSPVDPLDPWRR